MGTIKTESAGGVTTIRLSRPEVRNALDDVLIADLTAAVASLPTTTKVVVLAGEGPAFCSGADAQWMKRSRTWTREENQRDASAVSSLLQAVDECPLPVVGRIHGAALGGGAGLAAACDVAVAEDGTQFGFPEVRLGLVPAVISTYVLPKIGPGAARRYFVTGERFGPAEALSMGLIHEVAPKGKLDERVAGIVAEILKGGALALQAAKRLIREVGGLSRERAIEMTTRLIAELRISPEAQEGLAAFLEKRKPNFS
ncbi:MAG TPA: enoyl-CoA hydratase-related protein [Planctomycetota bacterium]|nr:enoyl-CoA hydratase-related protein [Planctomycetota bacterium]